MQIKFGLSKKHTESFFLEYCYLFSVKCYYLRFLINCVSFFKKCIFQPTNLRKDPYEAI